MERKTIQQAETVEELMRFASREFLPDLRTDLRFIHGRERSAEKCGCRTCLALYANALRYMSEKWKIPDEDQICVEADLRQFERTRHGAT